MQVQVLFPAPHKTSRFSGLFLFSIMFDCSIFEVINFRVLRKDMNEFSLSLDSLSNGWATLTFADSENNITLEVSYVPNDTLSELLDGAIRLLDGRSSEIVMSLEPKEVIFALAPSGIDEFFAKIEVYEFIGTRLRFARQLLKVFDAYPYLYDQESYNSSWRHPYPLSLVKRLRQTIAAQKSVPEKN